MDPAAFRNLIKQISGKEITSVQAAAFLELFQDELTAAEVTARRKFVEKHFGAKNQNQ